VILVIAEISTIDINYEEISIIIIIEMGRIYWNSLNYIDYIFELKVEQLCCSSFIVLEFI